MVTDGNTGARSDEAAQGGAHKMMKYGMWACCAVMLLPIGAYLLAGDGLAGAGGSLLAFAPLLLCVGMHLVMHKLMGKSCHDSAHDHGHGKAPGAAQPSCHATEQPPGGDGTGGHALRPRRIAAPGVTRM
jgi:hypothetical protein